MADTCFTQQVLQERRPQSSRMGEREQPYEPTREELLYMVSILEGELQARDIVIATIKDGKPEVAHALSSLRQDGELAWVDGQQNRKTNMTPNSGHHLDQLHYAMDWHQRVYQQMIEEIDSLQYHQRQLQIQSERKRDTYFQQRLGDLNEFIQQDKVTDLVQAMLQHDVEETLPCVDCPFCQIVVKSKYDGSLYEAEKLYTSLKDKNGFSLQETEFKQLLVLMALRETQMKSLVEELKLLQRKVHKFRKRLHDLEHKDGLRGSSVITVGKDIVNSLENLMYTICTNHLQEDQDMSRPRSPEIVEETPKFEEIWIDQSPYDNDDSTKTVDERKSCECNCCCGEEEPPTKYEPRLIDTFIKMERSTQTEEIEINNHCVEKDTQTECTICGSSLGCLCAQKKSKVCFQSRGIQTCEQFTTTSYTTTTTNKVKFKETLHHGSDGSCHNNILDQRHNGCNVNTVHQQVVYSPKSVMQKPGFKVMRLSDSGIAYAVQNSLEFVDSKQFHSEVKYTLRDTSKTNGTSVDAIQKHSHINGESEVLNSFEDEKSASEIRTFSREHVSNGLATHKHDFLSDIPNRTSKPKSVEAKSTEFGVTNLSPPPSERTQCLSPLSWDCNEVLDAVSDESDIIEESDINHNSRSLLMCEPIKATIRMSLSEEQRHSAKPGFHCLSKDGHIMGVITVEPTMSWDELDRQISSVIEHYSISVCSDDMLETHSGSTNCALTLGLTGKDIQHYRACTNQWIPGHIPASFSRPVDLLMSESRNQVQDGTELKVEADIYAVLKDVTDVSLARLALETFIPLSILEEYMQLIKYHKGVVFTGPPGFCKKEIALDLALCLENDLRQYGVDVHVEEVSSYEELTEYLQTGDVVSPLNSVHQSVSVRSPSHHNKATIIVFEDIQDVSEMELFAQFISMATTWSGAVMNGDAQVMQKQWYFIATMDDAIRMDFVDWSLQHQLFWVSLNSELSPGKDMLWRYFKSLLIQQQKTQQLCRSESVYYAVKWIFQVWQRLNKFFNKLELNELLLGPKYFYTCPIQADNPKKILRWMCVMWNSGIAPNVKQALMTRSGESVSDDIIMNVLSGLLHKAVEPGCPASPNICQYLQNFAGYKVSQNHATKPHKMAVKKTTKAVDTEV